MSLFHNDAVDEKLTFYRFGYVEYKSIEDAKTAIENLDMQVFEGRNLVCQFHKAKEQSRDPNKKPYVPNAPSKTIFIGNMSFEMSDKDLNDLFRDVRNVVDVRVAIDRRTGQPRGFAHADFVDVQSATKAREALNGKVKLQSVVYCGALYPRWRHHLQTDRLVLLLLRLHQRLLACSSAP